MAWVPGWRRRLLPFLLEERIKRSMGDLRLTNLEYVRQHKVVSNTYSAWLRQL